MENKTAKSSIIMDTLKLCIITLVAGLLLSATYEITLEPKEHQAFLKKLDAYQTVMTETDHTEEDTHLQETGMSMVLKDLNASYDKVAVSEVVKSFNANNELLGYIVTVNTTASYKDSITLTIGYSLDGTVTGIEILSINETAGLGMKAKNNEFKDQFGQKDVKQFVVSKVGATKAEEIDAISGATITTNAVVNAVNGGIGFLQEVAEVGGGLNE